MHRRLVALVLAVLLVAALGACGSGGGSSSDGAADGAGPLTGATAPPSTLGGSGPLAAAKVYEGLSQTHVAGAIRYRQTPPVGGDHDQVWQNCGFYAAAVGSPNAVHSMEHGAVWITFRPSLPEAQQQVLKDLVVDNPGLLVSPWKDDALPSPVVLTAWGVQLGVPNATAPAVAAFVKQFQFGPQTKEQGIPCNGGIGAPEVQSRAPVG